MNSRLILPAVLGALLMSTPAFANSTARTRQDEHDHKVTEWWQADQCRSLQNQVDQALETHGKTANVKDAKAMRDQGVEYCAHANYGQGISQLRLALKQLGVTPKT